jgi:hypothetical protein
MLPFIRWVTRWTTPATRTASRSVASLGIVTMLRDSDWAREGYQPEYGAFTAEKWLENWVAHDTTHIN